MTQTKDTLMIGQQIRDRREVLGMTQAQLAERSGTHQSVIAAIESGQRAHLSTRTISTIASSLVCEAVIMLKPQKDRETIFDERSTQLAQSIIAESSGSTALELQLPDTAARNAELQHIKDDILKHHKSAIWQKK